MKAKLELPGPLVREVERRAFARGETLNDFVIEALRARLEGTPDVRAGPPPWMAGFGRLKRLHKETARIQALIDADLDAAEAGDQA